MCSPWLPATTSDVAVCVCDCDCVPAGASACAFVTSLGPIPCGKDAEQSGTKKKVIVAFHPRGSRRPANRLAFRASRGQSITHPVIRRGALVSRETMPLLSDSGVLTSFILIHRWSCTNPLLGAHSPAFACAHLHASCVTLSDSGYDEAR
jgi:hypothetical protein